MSTEHLGLARARASRSRAAIVCALGSAAARARCAGWIGSAAIALSFLSGDRRAAQAAGPARGRAPGRLERVRPTRTAPASTSELGDPGRPAVGVHGAGRQRRVVPDPPLLGRLHGVATAATRASSRTSTSSSSRCCCWSWRQLRAADRRLGVRGRGLVPADLVLVPARDRHHAGIKAFVMNVIGDMGLVIGAFLLFHHTGSLDYAGVFATADDGVHAATTARSWPPA